MTVPVVPAPLAAGVSACFTARDPQRPTPPVGAAGNLSHRRPHRPDDLARARAEVAAATGTGSESWHFMQQVHGAEVGCVEPATPRGAELRGVDALVTLEPQRPLVVCVADCVPVLLAGSKAVAAVHAGRQGLLQGVVGRTLDVLVELGEAVDGLRAVIGPAICGRCYEVPAALRDEVAALRPAAASTTRWETPGLDLVAGVEAELATRGCAEIERVGGCTLEEEGYFSHRGERTAGRQIGLVVREAAP